MNIKVLYNIKNNKINPMGGGGPVGMFRWGGSFWGCPVRGVSGWM